MTYEEALSRIHGFLVFGSRLGLDRMKRLMELLGNPQDGLNVIHVAGTNGKGSVTRYVYSALNASGYRTGGFFSPYIERFTERIEWCGREISQEELAECAELVLEKADLMKAEGFEPPTEFEIVTAIGFVYFDRKGTDFAVLEVGLGGRGDSTNICERPLVTAVTSIDFDHMAQLGNTLGEIAAEKAGIIKKNVPVVYNVDSAEAENAILKKADIMGAKLFNTAEAVLSGVELNIDGSSYNIDFNIGSRRIFLERVRIKMHGMHQIRNSVCALYILYILKGMCGEGCGAPDLSDLPGELSEESIRKGLEDAFQPARFEIIKKDPYVILDGAHNIAGVRALTETVSKLFYPADNVKMLLCTGILGDKQHKEMAEELSGVFHDVIVTRVPNPRAESAEKLAEEFASSGVNVLGVFDDYRDAVRMSETVEGRYDAVVWAGSLYLMGAVRSGKHQCIK